MVGASNSSTFFVFFSALRLVRTLSKYSVSMASKWISAALGVADYLSINGLNGSGAAVLLVVFIRTSAIVNAFRLHQQQSLRRPSENRLRVESIRVNGSRLEAWKYVVIYQRLFQRFQRRCRGDVGKWRGMGEHKAPNVHLHHIFHPTLLHLSNIPR